ncbi:MAG: ankyrin repeat domain-containing protein, partial [Gammaproteobacteria bacterium]
LVKGGADPNFVPDMSDLPKSVVQSELKQFGNVPKAKKYKSFMTLVMFNRRPPLGLAAAYDHPACVRELVEKGAEVSKAAPGGYTSLMGAVDIGKSAAVTDLLLHAGADVHARTKRGVTALFMVVGEAREIPFPPYCLRCAKLLIKAGADVNAVDNAGDTPLIFAAGAKGALPLVRLLVSSGADINYRNPKTGMTALKAARAAGTIKIMDYLKANGAASH